jgi:hypothetical protein
VSFIINYTQGGGAPGQSTETPQVVGPQLVPKESWNFAFAASHVHTDINFAK